eukprot:CAMPEP_0170485262 /NCGR_PEP_ID=MMETSP0208-20121228/4575_1 /TAXON_ID=197538 /ORGANISM="Strombidium inclinatum, Strain S3" /LENGTH=51 /DNA_ID=CAMNT_0010758859 /DNA_START=26 /DNA_END=178 /DNA_ORIENTATION=-
MNDQRYFVPAEDIFMKKRKTTKNGATTIMSSDASEPLKNEDDLPRENKWGT